MNLFFVRKKLLEYLEEDAFFSDITTKVLGIEGKKGKMRFVSKGEGIFAGGPFVKELFKLVDENSIVKITKKEGEPFSPGETLLEAEGDLACFLTLERLALNILQRLSGIACKTWRMVKLLEGTKAILLDTRKTTPGFRFFEKYAVRIAGAKNHRMGLFDGVIIKDNHVRAVGSVRKAVELARKRVPMTLKIEVEVLNLEEFREALEAGPDIIMLDNMSLEEMRIAVKEAAGRVKLEASGKVDEHNIKEVASTGVDYISSGAIIHSAPWVDISAEIVG